MEQSASLIEEIIAFITRVNTTPNFVFDEEFSVELEHYCKELEFLVQTLQLAIDINRGFTQDKREQEEGMSMSAFLRASHRLRSMSLVSGYLLSQKGAFVAKVTLKPTKVVEQGSEWHLIIPDAELNVVFHPKYGCF